MTNVTTAKIAAGTGTYRRAMLLLAAAATSGYMLKHGPQPLVPEIGASFGLTPAAGSLVVAAEMVGMVLMLLLVLFASERMNRKRCTGLGLLITGLLALGIGTVHVFPVVVALRFLQGMLLGTFPALMVAYINEEFAPELTGRVVGIYLGATAMGGFLGRVIGNAVTSVWGWPTAFVGGGVLAIAVASAYLMMLPAPRTAHTARATIDVKGTLLPLLTDRRLLCLNVIGFVIMGSNAALCTYINFVLKRAPYFFNAAQLAPIFAMQLCGCVSSTVAGRLLDKHSRYRIMEAALAMAIVGALTMLLFAPVMKLVGLGVFLAGVFAVHTAATSTIGKLEGVSKAPATSLYMLSYYLGGGAMSFAGGVLYQTIGWAGVVGMVAVASVAAIACSRVLEREVEGGKSAASKAAPVLTIEAPERPTRGAVFCPAPALSAASA